MKRKFIVILFNFLLSTHVFANDAIEGAATGNIVFETTPEIQMLDEKLQITKLNSKTLGSEKVTIDVDFQFKNISNHDVIRKIAFVLPPVQCREDASSLWRGLESDKKNDFHFDGLKDFSTTVDGKTQAYTVRKEAFLGKKNITKLLSDLKIPLNPCNITMTSDGKPDPRYRSNLIKNKLLTETNDAAWAENIYFEWTQNFPAGKTINIHHHYTAIPGEAVLSLRSEHELNDYFTENSIPYKPIWNTKIDTLTTKKPLIFSHKGENSDNDEGYHYCVIPKWLQYNLMSGAYWKGGIENFKLIIEDKDGTPFAINEFYRPADNIEVTSDQHSITFSGKHFVPTKNLLVLFLSLPKSKEDYQACGL